MAPFHSASERHLGIYHHLIFPIDTVAVRPATRRHVRDCIVIWLFERIRLRGFFGSSNTFALTAVALIGGSATTASN